MTDRPIAVVTVCKNPGLKLKASVESVGALKDRRIRHIVVDGASSDGTVSYLKSIEASLYFWSSEPDRGIYDAMNKGWAAAPMDSYIIFVGADDLLLGIPSTDELARLEAAGFEIVYGTTRSEAGPFRSRYGAELRLRNTLHHQSLLIRKTVHPQPPFDSRHRVYGDWDLNLRLWRAGVQAVRSESLIAAAASGGISAVQPLGETFRVARHNSGFAVATVAWTLAAASRARRVAVRNLRHLTARTGIRA